MSPRMRRFRVPLAAETRRVEMIRGRTLLCFRERSCTPQAFSCFDRRRDPEGKDETVLLAKVKPSSEEAVART